MPRRPLGDNDQCRTPGPISRRPRRRPPGNPLLPHCRSPQPSAALARFRRRPARPSGRVSSLARGSAREPSGRRHRRSLAGHRRPRPRRTRSNRAAQRLRPRLSRARPQGLPRWANRHLPARRFVAHQGTARRARVPPVRYRDNHLERRKPGSLLRADCWATDRTEGPNAAWRLTGPKGLWRRSQPTSRAPRHPGRHQSERPADINRNGWPTSIGMPGRHHRNPQGVATGELSGRAWLTGELAERPGSLCREARANHARKGTGLGALERGRGALCGDEESGS
jgi:hypothetical protein